MTEFVALMSATLSNISAFLMAEPMVYFVGLAVLAFIVGIFVSVWKTSIKSI